MKCARKEKEEIGVNDVSVPWQKRIISDCGRCWVGVDTVLIRRWYGVGIEYQCVISSLKR